MTSTQTPGTLTVPPVAVDVSGPVVGVVHATGEEGSAPRVVGLDLSIASTGVAAADGTTFTISTKAVGDARLVEIETALLDHIVTADFAVLEDLPFHAKAAGISGMVHGIVRKILVETGTPYATVVPSSLKKYATGNGGCDKHLMRMEAYKRTGGLEFADDNQCDAWWLRLMGLDLLGHPEFPMPKVNRGSLEKMKRAVVS